MSLTQSTQRWWITGASAGIGRELALRLVADGHLVYATARNQAELNRLAEPYRGRLIPLPADVADSAAMDALWQSLPQPPEYLDGVIFSAGICEYVDVPSLSAASFRRVMDVNFHGMVNSCRSALPLLQASRPYKSSQKPKLIGIGSLSSIAGLPRAEAYGASKAAVDYFLQALRVDVGHEIDVTVVQPGFVDTRLTAVNDFPMPWIWSVSRAADYLYDRLWSGKRLIRFPWQLALTLRLGAMFPSLWYGVIAPRLRRVPSPTSTGATP